MPARTAASSSPAPARQASPASADARSSSAGAASSSATTARPRASARTRCAPRYAPPTASARRRRCTTGVMEKFAGRRASHRALGAHRQVAATTARSRRWCSRRRGRATPSRSPIVAAAAAAIDAMTGAVRALGAPARRAGRRPQRKHPPVSPAPSSTPRCMRAAVRRRPTARSCSPAACCPRLRSGAARHEHRRCRPVARAASIARSAKR